jgi:hypothetical protein
MMKRGWEMKYIPLALACGASPDTAKAYFSQQVCPLGSLRNIRLITDQFKI